MTQSAPANLLADASAPAENEAGGCGGRCSCGERAEAAPELDVRVIPPAVHHAIVLVAFASYFALLVSAAVAGNRVRQAH